MSLTYLNKDFNFISKTDSAFVAEMGAFIKHHRLMNNKTQQELCREAGLKPLTLSKIENGSSFTATTFIRLLRGLNLLDSVMHIFKIDNLISPIVYAKLEAKKRKRVRHKTKTQ